MMVKTWVNDRMVHGVYLGIIIFVRQFPCFMVIKVSLMLWLTERLCVS